MLFCLNFSHRWHRLREEFTVISFHIYLAFAAVPIRNKSQGVSLSQSAGIFLKETGKRLSVTHNINLDAQTTKNEFSHFLFCLLVYRLLEPGPERLWLTWVLSGLILTLDTMRKAKKTRMRKIPKKQQKSPHCTHQATHQRMCQNGTWFNFFRVAFCVASNLDGALKEENQQDYSSSWFWLALHPQ